MASRSRHTPGVSFSFVPRTRLVRGLGVGAVTGKLQAEALVVELGSLVLLYLGSQINRHPSRRPIMSCIGGP